MRTCHIIFHKADWDGLMSAAICKYFLEGPGVELVMHPYDYGDPVPDVPLAAADTDVFMVDISIDELLRKDPRIFWIDHHKTAIEKHPGLTFGLQMDGVAACRLCWNYFTDHKTPSKEDFVSRSVQEPYIVRLCGEYDVWDKRDPNAEALQYGLNLLSGGVLERVKTLVHLLCLNRISAANLNELLKDGALCQSYQQRQDEILCAKTYPLTFEGLDFAVINARGNSLVFKTLPEDFKASALMLWRFEEGKIRVSMYARPGYEHIDLSEIALRYGGGGHRNACGFEVKVGSKDFARMLCTLNGLTVILAGGKEQ